MTGFVIAALGVWVFFSGFILLVICMNSSRLNRMQGPVRRYPARTVISRSKGLSEVQPGSSPVSAE